MELNSTKPIRGGGAIPVMGFGTSQLTEDTASVVGAALDTGYRMIDTSGDYGTQAGVGEALRRSELTTDQVFVVTKVEPDEDSYEATARNLDELGLDYVDLMLIHHPPSEGAGATLWKGLQRARDEGMARRLGVSNFSLGLIDQLVEQTGETPAVNQIEWSPFGWDPGVLGGHTDRGILLQAFSPLMRGTRLDDPTLIRLAEAHDRSPAQVVLRWHLQLGVVPLPKAASVDHLRENASVFDFQLDSGAMEEISGLNANWSAFSN